MGDLRLRDLERAWAASGAREDGLRYLGALERSGAPWEERARLRLALGQGYHSAALRLLPEPPGFSEAAAAAVRSREAALGWELPEAVREWYSLEGAVELLSQGSFPLPVRELGGPIYLEVDDALWEIEGALAWFMTESLGACSWAFARSGDDPEVWVQDAADLQIAWRRCAPRFSDWIFAWLWDWTGGPKAVAGAEPLVSDDLDALRARFSERPTTERWPGRYNYRFEGPDGRVLVMHTPDVETSWEVQGTSEAARERLIASLAELPTLRRARWDRP